ncbi:hypothetical protein ES332_A11G267100v1 [Gossypium tomentosum]|uniref:Uncharacterized protein n=1 Tax=Gossypium tomentosum TaxID=34277 RepID=A0A5D2NJF5_GOSTO|nr:hypothetical protein ES332_A11G267100v1 [Gossypium tomentosum]
MAVRLKVTPQWRCSKHIHNFLLFSFVLADSSCHDGRRGAGLAASDRSIVYGVTSGARSQYRTGFHKYYWNLQKTQEGFTFKFEFVAKGSQSQDISELIISGERKVKKEEFHFKVKAKDVEPNHEKEELHFKLTVTLLVSKYCVNLAHQPRKLLEPTHCLKSQKGWAPKVESKIGWQVGLKVGMG